MPGVASNVPSGEPAEPAQMSTTNSVNKNETVNYEISRTVSKIIEPTGTIKKLSVAVLVDGTYEPAKSGGEQTAGGAQENARKYVPRTEAEMKQIEEIVRKAMGYSEERQDQVEVVNVQFGFETADMNGMTADDASGTFAMWAPYIRYGVAAVLFALILIFVVRPVLAMLTARP
ncbi:MAG: flagellar M-ring protein FliF, partial [Nitrospiraceae bacterium]